MAEDAEGKEEQNPKSTARELCLMHRYRKVREAAVGSHAQGAGGGLRGRLKVHLQDDGGEA